MEDLIACAREYCESKSFRFDETAKLGDGTDGAVWKTKQGTAIKVLEREKNYFDELECYERFQEAGINKLNDFNVPELEGCDHALLVIEMSIVKPPFLLDFGKVYLDIPPPYFEDVDFMNQWREEWRELFDDDWPTVQSLLNRLEQYGIYYVDPKPANIRFRI